LIGNASAQNAEENRDCVLPVVAICFFSMNWHHMGVGSIKSAVVSYGVILPHVLHAYPQSEGDNA
jgi:hypothetical protein